MMISIPTIKRFPSYLRLLQYYKEKGFSWISATTLAEDLGLTAVQVRKDMAGTGVEGKPKVGFEIAPLIDAIMQNLGWDQPTDAILVGAGHLGGALARYEGFASYGLRIIAVFDNDPVKIGMKIGTITVLPMKELRQYIDEHSVHIAVMAVPAATAQELAEDLVSFGIKAIWNFAPKDLKLPAYVIVQRTDLATSFAVLSAKCKQLLSCGQSAKNELV
ncbi:MAG: redox-sensing transcriptional repressor Rex [Sphaerochaetaceae bacterium]|jgi:redox-sensing transcriptional repressor|nr:redox-sensing transcriptional repressor Rex [Sphaerochaetaceae bacterium]MDD2406197.1 redox-sensing transcriptional repressor Rex [Sphaerochaetaceae bacterium]MDD3670913.1 redox-sensing transcriptional repressor Rex [Sphaerochaetaceae bacterium]MDD4840367.1 redox-sensing transcriptional repressor Rex [Sphaerochaetaceae bacterium]NLO60071.1 redox-sensing transcriptional repressor Rex [Spirochaetales bacterium]